MNLWKLLTDLDKDKQAISVVLGLQGKYRWFALEIQVGELNAENGMDVLLAKLDKEFEKDSALEDYDTYAQFEGLVREH